MLRRSGTVLPLWAQLASNPLSSKCFRKNSLARVKNIITSRTHVFFDHIAISCYAERLLTLVKSRTKRRPGRALAQAKSGPRAASSGLFLRSNQDRRSAPGVRLLRPNRGLAPRQTGFFFGQIRTDAALQACVYSGRIVASRRVRRSFPSITTISDRLGPCAPKAIHTQAVTYPAEGHLEDYAPLKGVV
jgi:hypothetical protein